MAGGDEHADEVHYAAKDGREHVRGRIRLNEVIDLTDEPISVFIGLWWPDKDGRAGVDERVGAEADEALCLERPRDMLLRQSFYPNFM